MGDDTQQDVTRHAPVNTGDSIKLIVGTTGNQCGVEVQGQRLPGVYGFKIETGVRKATRLSFNMCWPWPAVIEGTGKDRHAHTETFEGFFVAPADWEQYQAWLRMHASYAAGAGEYDGVVVTPAEYREYQALKRAAR